MELGPVDFEKNGRMEFTECVGGTLQNFKFCSFDIDFHDVGWSEVPFSVALDNFDFNFNKKMNRSLVFDLATAAFVSRREDALFLGPPGTGKSESADAGYFISALSTREARASG